MLNTNPPISKAWHFLFFEQQLICSDMIDGGYRDERKTNFSKGIYESRSSLSTEQKRKDWVGACSNFKATDGYWLYFSIHFPPKCKCRFFVLSWETKKLLFWWFFFGSFSCYATEKPHREEWKGNARHLEGLVSNGCHLVQKKRAKVGHVRMQMVLEQVGVIYKTGGGRWVRIQPQQGSNNSSIRLATTTTTTGPIIDVWIIDAEKKEGKSEEEMNKWWKTEKSLTKNRRERKERGKRKTVGSPS